MLDPISLFSWEPHVDQRRLSADTLVVTLGSFVDAGHSQRLVNAQLLDQLPNRIVGRFDADQVFDYAGRRPLIVFDGDHYADYAQPGIDLHLVTDRDGQDFLLLTGPEPSLQWERMAAAIAHVIDQVGVRRTILAHAIPAGVPHTRRTPLTRYASDPALLGDERSPLGSFAMSASFSGVLTLRLGQAGHQVLGAVALVPHYIADSDYPDAAAALIEGVREIGKLALPAEGFQLPAAALRAQLEQHRADNEDFAAHVAALEQAYDQAHRDGSLTDADSVTLPSADEIGAQVEEYLAGLQDPPPSEGSPPPLT
ncbi:MAG: PAC2 family protein [Propioniciclava sp.]|uniref:PAC2 family protein n=1 Tax=Propioniciclava sp. TaxID=2038686 RepID=UPI0039E244A9